jgi:hypothetical protein
MPCSAARLCRLLEQHGNDLARRPLYVSLDKDVMTAEDATVNWDSGHLCVDEVTNLLEAAQTAAKGHLVGMDVVGDWSEVRVQGAMRRLFHWTMHPPLAVEQEKATAHNQAVNLRLLDGLLQRGHRAA